jgi:hypothetical protein
MTRAREFHMSIRFGGKEKEWFEKKGKNVQRV